MIKKLKKQKNSWSILAILFLALILRLYRFHYPLADWHSWRQADTASVTREYVKSGQVDWLRPQYHDLSDIPSGLANPEGYRMVEFPLINGLIAHFLLFTQSLGLNLDLVMTSRAFSILASLLAIYFLYRLIKVFDDEKLALFSAFIYAILPYAIFYGRAILPEPFMLTLSLLSLWQWAVFCQKKAKRAKHYLLSLLSLALAALLKPFVVFLAPIYLAIAWHYLGPKLFKKISIYLFPILAFIPLWFWRDWIQNFLAGIPASDWLFNKNNIRLKPAWWRWLFYERLIKLILGFTGTILLFGNLWQINKKTLIYASWWLGIVLYFIVLASGNIQHDYYQNLMIPIVAISVARGTLIIQAKLKKTWLSTAFVGLVLLSAWSLSVKQIAGFFNVNNWEYVEAGQAVNRLTSSDALIIAPAMGDTAFLFQTNRRGWPLGFNIEEKIEAGATVYVSTSDDKERRQLEEKYQTLEKTDRYLILDLTKETIDL
jgi:hypothetical protein